MSSPAELLIRPTSQKVCDPHLPAFHSGYVEREQVLSCEFTVRAVKSNKYWDRQTQKKVPRLVTYDWLEDSLDDNKPMKHFEAYHPGKPRDVEAMLNGRAVRKVLQAPKSKEASSSGGQAHTKVTSPRSTGNEKEKEKAKKVAEKNTDRADAAAETQQNEIRGREIGDTVTKEIETSDPTTNHKDRARPVLPSLVSPTDSGDMPNSGPDKSVRPGPKSKEAPPKTQVFHSDSENQASQPTEVGPQTLKPETGYRPTSANKQHGKPSLGGLTACTTMTVPRDTTPWEVKAQPRFLQDKDGFRYCVELTRIKDQNKWVLSLYESTSSSVPKVFRFGAVLQNAQGSKILTDQKEPSPVLQKTRAQFNQFFLQKTGYDWKERLLRAKMAQNKWHYRAPAEGKPTGEVPREYTPGHPDCVQDLEPTAARRDLSRGDRVKKDRSPTEGPRYQPKIGKDARLDEVLETAKAYRSVGLGRQDQLQRKRKAYDTLDPERRVKVPKSNLLASSKKAASQTTLNSLENSKVGQTSTGKNFSSKKATPLKSSAAVRRGSQSSCKGGRTLSDEFITASDDDSD